MVQKIGSLQETAASSRPDIAGLRPASALIKAPVIGMATVAEETGKPYSLTARGLGSTSPGLSNKTIAQNAIVNKGTG